MAMRAAMDRFKKFGLSRSELILRSLPKYADTNQFEQSYKLYLAGNRNKINYSNRDSENLLVFPMKSFKKFTKSSMEKLITSSYETIKNSGTIRSAHFFNSVIRSYLTHDIDLDVSTIFTDMSSRNIEFNYDTYFLLIRLYSERGDMGSVQNLLTSMKSKNMTPSEECKYHIFAGFIKAEQMDQAKQFLDHEKLNENDTQLLIYQVKAYADIGNFGDVMETIKKIGENDKTLPSKLSLIIYRRLVNAKASETELEQILAFHDADRDVVGIANLIFHLNRAGFYNHSLKLMLKFDDKFVDTNFVPDIISSFNNIDCPINIYSTVLEKFLARIYPNASLNLFMNMDFNSAFKLTSRIISTHNSQSLISNLLVKAIKEKSIENIHETLHVALAEIPMRNLNTIVQLVLLPALLEQNMISSPQEVLQILPQFKVLILPSLCMHFLAKGDLVSFQSLVAEQKLKGHLNYSNYSRTNAKRILEHVPFKEMDKLVLEATNVFSPQFVNWLINSIVVERIVQLAALNNVSGVEEAVKLAKNFGTTFEKREVDFLKKTVPSHVQLFDELRYREGSERGENVREGTADETADITAH